MVFNLYKIEKNLIHLIFTPEHHCIKCAIFGSGPSVNQKYTVVSGQICLLMVLFRFAFPTTMNKLECVFGYPYSTCSKIVNYGLSLLYAKFGGRLERFDVDLVLARLHEYQDAIRVKSNGAVHTCFGFIDGTLHQICRPSMTRRRIPGIRNRNNIQRAAYSGHKRHHGLKFQSVVLPDGMIAQMFGPVEGRRHDITLLHLSGLAQRMQLLPPDAYIYGDQAYGVKPWLLSPFRGANKTIGMRRWNRHLRTCRISVEHGFKIVTGLWSHLKFVPAQKVFNTPVSKQYIVCTALANAHNCIYPNQVSQHYGLQPMSLEQYCAMYV